MRTCLMLLAVMCVAAPVAGASCPDAHGSFAECEHLLREAAASVVERGVGFELERAAAGASRSTQDADVEDGATGHGIGLTAGLTSGAGLAYRRFLTPSHGVHIGGIAFGDRTHRHANLGVEYLRMIHRRGASRLYWTLGGSVFYNRNETYIYPGCDPVPARPAPGQCDFSNPVQGWRGEWVYSVGPGIGLEWNPGPMGISLELPLAVRYRKDEEGFRFDSLLPIPNVSIVYYLPR
ncbi:MAG: hypothetical protein Q8L86_19550 [Vicinamibacterales bacterium]|nr:hypothetical protein [Vicinamibacterales bacterium]